VEKIGGSESNTFGGTAPGTSTKQIIKFIRKKRISFGD